MVTIIVSRYALWAATLKDAYAYVGQGISVGHLEKMVSLSREEFARLHRAQAALNRGAVAQISQSVPQLDCDEWLNDKEQEAHA